MMLLGLFHSSHPHEITVSSCRGAVGTSLLEKDISIPWWVTVGFAAMESLFPRVTDWSVGAKHFPTCWGTTLEVVFSSIRVFFNSFNGGMFVIVLFPFFLPLLVFTIDILGK